jgi:hypothetical protein
MAEFVGQDREEKQDHRNHGYRPSLGRRPVRPDVVKLPGKQVGQQQEYKNPTNVNLDGDAKNPA